MEWSLSTQQIPGTALVQPNSRYAGFEQAGSANLIGKAGAYPQKSDQPPVIDLSGSWQRCIDISRAFTHDTSFDLPPENANWKNVSVPQNYGAEPDLYQYFGPVWYKRLLPIPQDVHWLDLAFEAVDYIADVQIGHHYLGRHEGYFAPFLFDISNLIPEIHSSDLIVRVQDPLETAPDRVYFTRQRKKWIKGTMNYHDSRPGGMPGLHTPGWSFKLGQSRPSGGIVGPVRLISTGPVRIDGIFITPTSLRGDMHLCLLLLNRTNGPVQADLHLVITTPQKEQIQSSLKIALTPGSNRLDLESVLANPQVWYDTSLAEFGEPAIYECLASVVYQEAVSSSNKTNFGFRTADFPTEPHFHYMLNGEDIYIRAANYIPTQHWANIQEDSYLRDFDLLKQANLHSVGIHGHIQSPVCYNVADKAGISIFQDFPLQWTYASGSRENPGFIDKAVRMAAEMAYLLWNHPSVVYYAAHNEPPHTLSYIINQISRIDIENNKGFFRQIGLTLRRLILNAYYLPSSGSKTAEKDTQNYLIDAAIKATLEKVDPNRYVHLASGTGIDTHEYSGTINGGSVYDVGSIPAPFVSEFGSWQVNQTAVANSDQWAAPWPPTGKQIDIFCQQGLISQEPLETVGSFKRYGDLGSYAYASESKAAFVAKYQAEFFRINRDKPYRGYRWHYMVNHWGFTGAGLVDKDRKPTLAYDAIKKASRPNLIATTAQNTIFQLGDRIFPVYAINDRRISWEGTAYWKIERVRSCELITAEHKNQLSFIKNHVEGTYVTHCSNPLETLRTGEFTFNVPVSSTHHIGEIRFSATRYGAYRIVLAWNLQDHQEENEFIFLVAPEKWKPKPGLQIIESEMFNKQFEFRY